jgi:hypothetical protein
MEFTQAGSHRNWSTAKKERVRRNAEKWGRVEESRATPWAVVVLAVGAMGGALAGVEALVEAIL